MVDCCKRAYRPETEIFQKIIKLLLNLICNTETLNLATCMKIKLNSGTLMSWILFIQMCEQNNIGKLTILNRQHQRKCSFQIIEGKRY